jgi:hypothetical protein
VGGNLELRTEKGDKIQKLKSKKKKKISRAGWVPGVTRMITRNK